MVALAAIGTTLPGESLIIALGATLGYAIGRQLGSRPAQTQRVHRPHRSPARPGRMPVRQMVRGGRGDGAVLCVFASVERHAGGEPGTAVVALCGGEYGGRCAVGGGLVDTE